MLRDKNLIPLSHQHQHALAVCVRLDRALQAGEVDMEAWQAELQQIYESEIVVHFAAEERDLFPAAEKFSASCGDWCWNWWRNMTFCETFFHGPRLGSWIHRASACSLGIFRGTFGKKSGSCLRGCRS